MAKITAIDIDLDDSIILKKETVSNVNVTLEITFHPLDLKQEMEYAVLISLFDIKGKLDVHSLLPNWDDTQILEIEKSYNDVTLVQTRFTLKATKKIEVIKKTITFKLDYQKHVSTTSLEIDAIAYLIPAINVACKWSEAKNIEVIH
jgi:hypothetical protein